MMLMATAIVIIIVAVAVLLASAALRLSARMRRQRSSQASSELSPIPNRAGPALPTTPIRWQSTVMPGKRNRGSVK